MAHAQTADEIARQLEGVVTEMRVDLQRCEGALKALRNGANTTVTSPAIGVDTSKRTTHASRVRKTPISDEMVLQAVRAGADTGPKVAAALKTTHHTALKRLHALAESGTVTRSGERQHTRWAAEAGVGAS